MAVSRSRQCPACAGCGPRRKECPLTLVICPPAFLPNLVAMNRESAADADVRRCRYFHDSSARVRFAAPNPRPAPAAGGRSGAMAVLVVQSALRVVSVLYRGVRQFVDR